jgi:hypothetical protein
MFFSRNFHSGRVDGHRYTPKSAERRKVFPSSHASSSEEHQLNGSAVALVRGWTISLVQVSPTPSRNHWTPQPHRRRLVKAG